MMQSLEDTTRLVTSKPVQRAAVNVVLLVSGAVALLGLASLATALFFHNFVPDQFITSPIFLQYQSGVHPYGIAQLTYPSPKSRQDYDVSITLSMPRSPPNVDRGNFMVSLFLVRDGGKSYQTVADERHVTTVQGYLGNRHILFQSRRPALMPYEDPVISLAKRVFFVGYYVLFPRSQRRTMTIRLAERVNFDKTATQPTTALVEIEAGQDIQIYETTLTLTAQLRGLRWLMFHYRLLTYSIFTCLFWICEMLFMCLAWAVWSCTTTPKSTADKASDLTDTDYERYDNDGSDRPTSSITYGKQFPVKREPFIKAEESDDQERAISDIPTAGTEADDEEDSDDDDEDKRKLGRGTSFKWHGSESVRRRASRNAIE